MKKNKALLTGLAVLPLAGCWRLFVRPAGALTPNLVDGIAGFLYGVSIACMLLGLWRQRRGCSTT